MTTSSRISEIYSAFSLELKLLREEMDPVLKRIATNFDGFFISRIKPKESFAQKIETGYFKDPNTIIDLYAATIVVATYKEINLVERQIEREFRIKKKIENREKKPSDFVYDDIHLWIQYNPTVQVPGKEYLQRSFELQLKTFLQYGWYKSAHDILYKGDQLSWPRFRIAHQIRAMLEQSDQILLRIDKASDICPSNDYIIFSEKNRILDFIKKIWAPSLLPLNVKGLADNVHELLKLCGKSTDYLKQELESGRHDNLLSAASVTPYQAILGILIKMDPDSLYKGLKACRRNLYISDELKDIFGDIPEKIIDLSIKL